MTNPKPMVSPDVPNAAEVRAYLIGLQERVCTGLERVENGKRFMRDVWTRAEGGGGVTCVLEGGGVFEKAGVAFSHVRGDALPASATARKPELAGGAWEAMGVSIVVHPRNPHAPTSHANVRFFRTLSKDVAATGAWWFGGGFDLTPFYGYEEDAREWHAAARDALLGFGGTFYPRFKKNCDEYFYLKHRNEARGVGGIFFDDFAELEGQGSFAMMRAVGDAFLPAYTKIVERRRDTPYGEKEREFQLYRRGRYVEFNLVWDRGTLFGLQSGGRTESILMSMPPLARWDYARTWEAGSAEARLKEEFLVARDWV